MDLDESKAQLRSRLKALRAEMPEKERKQADRCIAEKVRATEAYRNAGVLCAYVSFGFEVDTLRIIENAWLDGKVVCSPRCVAGSRAMEWYVIGSFDGLIKSSFGVLEPDPSTLTRVCGFDSNAVALVPGLTFDHEGFRLGYGGGFYDFFLDGFPGVSLGLCRQRFYDGFVIPKGPYDKPVDEVITDGCGIV